MLTRWTFSNKRGFAFLLGVALIIGTGLSAAHLASRHGLRLALERGQLDAAAKYAIIDDQILVADQLSNILSHNSEIIRFLLHYSQSPKMIPPATQRDAVEVLTRYSKVAPDMASYLMNLNGTVLLASPHDFARRIVGQNLAHRPYFREGRLGNPGQHFGVGSVYKTRAYYSAHPVRGPDGRILGVAVLRKGVEPTEDLLRNRNPIYLIDRYGIVFLSNQPEAILRPLWPLADQHRALLERAGTYGEFNPTPLFPRPVHSAQLIQFRGSDYLATSTVFSNNGWQLLALEPLELRTLYSLIIASAFLLLLVLWIGGFWFYDRSAREAAKEFEHKNKQEELIRSLLDQLPEGVAVMTASGRILEANASFCQQLGVSRAQLDHRSRPEFFTAETNSLLERKIQELGTNPETAPFEGMNCRADGTSFVSEISLRRFPYAGEQAILLVSQDIQERKNNEVRQRQYEAQLYQSEKLASIGLLSASVAHEISNPLTILLGVIDQLKQQLLGTRPAEEFTQIKGHFEMLGRATSRITAIVSGLRNYSRSSSDSDEPINAHRIIEETTNLIGRMITKAGITLTLRLGSRDPNFTANSGKMQQVIMNLLVNARDAISDRPNAEIIIETRDREEALEISIADNGSGISPAHLSKLFKPFFTTKKRGSGTGLGLSISKSIIESAGGTLTVASTVGIGTTFTITLPRTRLNTTVTANTQDLSHGTLRATDALPSNHQIPRQTITGKALVVDDESDLRAILADQLRSFGLIVSEAATGQEALTLLQNEPFDFLITDLNMPVMSGYDLLLEVSRLNLAKMRRYVITGNLNVDTPEERRRLIRDLSNGTIRKPFNETDLWTIITHTTSSQKGGPQ